MTSARASCTRSCPSRARAARDWGYSWVPVVGPLIGGVLAGLPRRSSSLTRADLHPDPSAKGERTWLTSTSLAIDQGTTSTRAIVFDHGGQIVATGQKEHEQIFPRAGWVEHDPIGDLGQRPRGRRPRRSASADLNRQRHRRGRHHQPARDRRRVGQDHRRARLQRDRLAGHPHRRRSSTSSAATAAPTGTRHAWACRWRPTSPAPRSPGSSTTSRAPASGPRPATCCLGTIDTWVLWNLTGGVDGGVHVTDVTNASRTMLMDLDDPRLGRGHRGRHGHPAVDAARDPRPRPRSTATGARGGLLPDVPIAGILGDQQAATFGQACFEPGDGQEHLRHRQLHAAQHRHRGDRPVEERPADDGLLQDRRRSRRSTPWRARSPSPARWCSGCATTSA